MCFLMLKVWEVDPDVVEHLVKREFIDLFIDLSHMLLVPFALFVFLVSILVPLGIPCVISKG